MLRETLVALLVLTTMVLAATSAHSAMTAREFTEIHWTRDKIAVVQDYVTRFKDLGYYRVPDAYALTARMELNVHTKGQYTTWLDILVLTAAQELGMHQ